MQICGPITARLYAASSARDTDFMMKLLDVWPNGYAQRLTDGMVRARFREGMERPQLIEPGRVYSYSIDLWNTCQTFKKGHSIRIEIASTAFPNTIATQSEYGRAVREDDAVGSSAAEGLS